MELTDKEVQGYQQHIKESEIWLDDVRKTRTHLYKTLAGRLYRKNAVKASPINLFHSTVGIYLSLLVSRNPKCVIRADDPKFRASANSLTDYMRRVIRKIQLRRMLRVATMDALMSYGVVQTGVRKKNDVASNGRVVDEMEPFIENIDTDYFVFDPRARSPYLEDARWMGHRFALPLSVIREHYENTDGVKASTQLYPEYSQENISDRQNQRPLPKDIEELVDAHQLFIPRKKLLAVLPLEGQGTKALKEIPWDGPFRGPYETVGFMPLPGNPLWIPPAAQWLDLHDLVNVMLRKFRVMAEKMKSVLVYEEGADEDAQRIMHAPHGEAVKVVNRDRVGTVSYGEPSQMFVTFIEWLMKEGSYAMGNTDMLGGMSASARTATESATLSQSAGMRINDMVADVEDFARRCYEQFCYYELQNPFIDETIWKRVPDTTVEAPYQLKGKELGNHWDYLYEIVPYSMAPRTPQEAAQKMLLWFNQVVLPCAGLAPQLGQQVNIPKMVEMVGEAMGVEDLDEVFVADTRDPRTLAAQQGQGQPGVPGMGGGDGIKETMAEAIRMKMPQMNKGQVPSNMGNDAVAALAS